MKGMCDQRQFWGAGNIENQDFDFGEQGKCRLISGEQGNRYPHPREGLKNAPYTFFSSATSTVWDIPLYIFTIRGYGSCVGIVR